MMPTLTGVLLSLLLPGDVCGSPELIEAERQKLARTPEFAFYSSACLPGLEDPHFDPLPFGHADIGEAVRVGLRRQGVPLVDDPHRMETARPLNFCIAVRRSMRGYDYELHLAPAEWSADPPADVEEVGTWFSIHGSASREALRRSVLPRVPELARWFATEYKAARSGKARDRRCGRTRG